jgi:very-short-patch-repair endonuclease
MGWPEWKVGVEYDGFQHWTDAQQYAGDIDRLEFLAGLGWPMVRVSANHLRYQPQGIVQRTVTALRAAGYPFDTSLVRAAARDSRRCSRFAFNS